MTATAPAQRVIRCFIGVHSRFNQSRYSENRTVRGSRRATPIDAHQMVCHPSRPNTNGTGCSRGRRAIFFEAIVRTEGRCRPRRGHLDSFECLAKEDGKKGKKAKKKR
jgi:hypothetical protein